MIIDTHAHLYWESFEEDFDQVIQRAIDKGVTGMVNVGVDLQTSQTALEQVENTLANFPSLTTYSSIGIHPEEALLYARGKLNPNDSILQDIQKLEEIYHQNPEKVVMVGECGLDFYFREEEIIQQIAYQNNRHPELVSGSSTLEEKMQKQVQHDIKTLQRKLFQAQIELAKKLNLPLTVHCRDDRSQNPANTECWDIVIEMVKDHFGILHCYSGLEQTTKRALAETKFLFSFAGNITYKNNEYLREAIKIIPLERIVVETDCPFLPPQEFRGQRNETSFITETVKSIAQIKGLSIIDIEKVIYKNTNKLLLK